MSDQLISLPLKTTVEVDFIKPFVKYFTKTLGYKDKAKITAASGELNKLRLQVTSKSIKKTPIGLELVSRYADQIGLLASKIPSECLQDLQFTWEDGMDKGSLFSGKKCSATHPLLTFEHLCTLFNVAALQSSLGAEQRFADTDEELKNGAKLFQSAAGILEHISSTLTVLIAPTEPMTYDLKPSALSILSNLMLAQAQELIVKKAILDEMKAGLLAKVCLQTSEMYAETGDEIAREPDNGKYSWDRGWVAIIRAKTFLYCGLAEFFQAAASLEAQRYGDRIAWLQLSVRSLRKCQDKLKTIHSCSTYLNEATRLLETAKKENDFIYHELVPDLAILTPIDKVSSARLAKATLPVPEQLTENFVDLFGGLEFEKKETPLKAVLDASVHAAGFYMNKLRSRITKQ